MLDPRQKKRSSEQYKTPFSFSFYTLFTILHGKAVGAYPKNHPSGPHAKNISRVSQSQIGPTFIYALFSAEIIHHSPHPWAAIIQIAIDCCGWRIWRRRRSPRRWRGWLLLSRWRCFVLSFSWSGGGVLRRGEDGRKEGEVGFESGWMMEPDGGLRTDPVGCMYRWGGWRIRFD